MARLMYHEDDSSTRRRRERRDKRGENQATCVRFSLRLSLCSPRLALKACLPQFDGSDDDGSLAGVGGVGSEGSIDFELHEHFGAGREVLDAVEIAGLGEGVGGEEVSGRTAR